MTADYLQLEFERVARHEAAHAVIGIVLGFKVNRVYLHARGGNTDCEGGGYGDEFWKRSAVMVAAGGASDRAQGHDKVGSDGDLREIGIALAQLSQPFDPYAKADELVVAHERAIDVVAGRLAQRRRAQRRDARAADRARSAYGGRVAPGVSGEHPALSLTRETSTTPR